MRRRRSSHWGEALLPIGLCILIAVGTAIETRGTYLNRLFNQLEGDDASRTSQVGQGPSTSAPQAKSFELLSVSESGTYVFTLRSPQRQTVEKPKPHPKQKVQALPH